MITIGNNIKHYRNSRKITQAQMATKLKIPRSTYANYENNTRQANYSTMANMAEILGVHITFLFGNTYYDIKNIPNEYLIKEIESDVLLREMLKRANNGDYIFKRLDEIFKEYLKR